MKREFYEDWNRDPDWDVYSQDEDLMFACEDNLELLEEFLLRRDALPGKREVLLSAICVVIYDHLLDEENPDAGFSSSGLGERAVAILQQNLSVFDELDEEAIPEYLRRVVYPVLGRPLPGGCGEGKPGGGLSSLAILQFQWALTWAAQG